MCVNVMAILIVLFEKVLAVLLGLQTSRPVTDISSDVAHIFFVHRVHRVVVSWIFNTGNAYS